MECGISREVVDFVGKHIRSLGQLEILLLVSTPPLREWSAASVDAVIRSNPEMVTRWCENFVHTGIFAKSVETGLYRFQPSGPGMAKEIEELAADYRTSRHKIVELIYARQPSAIVSFSEAFRLRKDI